MFALSDVLKEKCEYVIPRIWVRPAVHFKALGHEEAQPERSMFQAILMRWHPAFMELLYRIKGEQLYDLAARIHTCVNNRREAMDCSTG